VKWPGMFMIPVDKDLCSKDEVTYLNYYSASPNDTIVTHRLPSVNPRRKTLED
jgi:hypothetical protein